MCAAPATCNLASIIAAQYTEHSSSLSHFSHSASSTPMTSSTFTSTNMLQSLVSLTVALLPQNSPKYPNSPSSPPCLIFPALISLTQIHAAVHILIKESILTILCDSLTDECDTTTTGALCCLENILSLYSHDTYDGGVIDSQILNHNVIPTLLSTPASSLARSIALSRIIKQLALGAHTRDSVVMHGGVQLLTSLLVTDSLTPTETHADLALTATQALETLILSSLNDPPSSAAHPDGDELTLDHVTIHHALSHPSPPPASTNSVISLTISTGALPVLVAMSSPKSPPSLRVTALTALQHITYDGLKSLGRNLQRRELCTAGAVEAFVSIIRNPDTTTADELTLATTGLANMLQVSATDDFSAPPLDNLQPSPLRTAASATSADSRNSEFSQEIVSRTISPHHGLNQTADRIIAAGGVGVLMKMAARIKAHVLSPPDPPPFPPVPPSSPLFPPANHSLPPSSSTPPPHPSQHIPFLQIYRLFTNISLIILSNYGCKQKYPGVFARPLCTLYMNLLKTDTEFANTLSPPPNLTTLLLLHELKLEALRGLLVLSQFSPIQLQIIEYGISRLMDLKTNPKLLNSLLQGDEVKELCQSIFINLGFKSGDMDIKLSGNDVNLLADWFYMERGLIIQSMAREEIKNALYRAWVGGVRGTLSGLTHSSSISSSNSRDSIEAPRPTVMSRAESIPLDGDPRDSASEMLGLNDSPEMQVRERERPAC